ncbi:ATP synthase complex assembly protein ATP12 Ecym_8121 [Eremothecium cymbalariae DBVPG|uniref:ATP synthase mitochondrial F1 complex assembly factor 2 n=1 Tax=Eremothecium cymbalariae (strain CBS 270.75 / DBVPG 7215 / KCTC 17166 / NRRL Y-17582) TaxID=931890 RepID=G8JX38_ERECY|nr:Hypothetical protein Ecym_8121 [Eremothecium cymbalariae DBVPG\
MVPRVMQRGVINNFLKNARANYSSLNASPLGIDGSCENNLKTETNILSKTLVKFWDKVTLKKCDNTLTLQIYGNPVRTPLGNSLSIPSNRVILAHMLKDEWSNVTKLSIKTHSLPLTSIVSRCIDLQLVSKPGTDPELLAKIGGGQDVISESLLRYLDTDTLLCFSPKSEYEGALRRAQDKIYLPILSAVESFLGKYSDLPVRLQLLDSDLHGLRGNRQSDSTRAAALKYLRSLNTWDLAVFEKTVLTTKSFICGIILLQNKTNDATKAMQMTMEDIANAATLETIYQVDKWGEVEDTHDVDKRDIRRNIIAAGIVAYRE